MGKVIKGFFGAERASGEQTAPSENEIVQERPGHSGEVFTVLRAQDVCLKILGYLTSLAGNKPSTEVLATAERAWRSLSDAELIEAAENSTSSDWRKNPGRFEALVREIYKRFPDI